MRETQCESVREREQGREGGQRLIPRRLKKVRSMYYGGHGVGGFVGEGGERAAESESEREKQRETTGCENQRSRFRGIIISG